MFGSFHFFLTIAHSFFFLSVTHICMHAGTNTHTPLSHRNMGQLSLVKDHCLIIIIILNGLHSQQCVYTAHTSLGAKTLSLKVFRRFSYRNSA